MASHVGRVVQRLRNLLEGEAPLRDAELLGRFIASRDEAAFAALVERHGPLVLGLCRRVLQSTHDAEDALQATFLVLARRAAALRKPDSVAGWLYGVAYRVARKMKTQRDKRGELERKAAPPSPAQPEDLSWRELCAVLDEEIQRLPEAQRQPLLLCYFEGLTQEEAAGQLGWPRGTLKRRLERGRTVLKDRLTRRGLTLAAALIATLPAGDALAVAPPAHLSASLAQAAALFVVKKPLPATLAPLHVVTLAEGVLQTMFVAKLKLLSAVVAATLVLGFGAAAFARQALTPAPEGKARPGLIAQPAPLPRPSDIQDKPDAGKNIPLGQRWYGWYGAEHNHVRLVIRDEKQWEAVWAKALGAKPMTPVSPEPQPLAKVDFTKSMVLAVFMGDRENGGHVVDITRVVATADGWTVYVHEYSPPLSGPPKVTQQPCCLVEVPRFDGKVTFVDDGQAKPGQGAKEEAVPIRKQWTQDLCRWQKQGEMVARGADAWKTAWARASDARQPVPPLPEIDFEKEMALAVFMGMQSTHGAGVKITRVVRTDSEMRVYVRYTLPGQGQGKEDLELYPSCLAIVPLFDGKVMFLEDKTVDAPKVPKGVKAGPLDQRTRVKLDQILVEVEKQPGEGLSGKVMTLGQARELAHVSDGLVWQFECRGWIVFCADWDGSPWFWTTAVFVKRGTDRVRYWKEMW